MCKGGAVYGGSCGCRYYGGLGNDEVTENKGGAKKLSEYNKFVKREFKKCQKDYPSKKAPEIMKIVAKKWKSSKKH